MQQNCNICEFTGPTFERTCEHTSNAAHWSITFERECERAKHAAQGSACERHNERVTHASSLESLRSNVRANETRTHTHWNVTCKRSSERSSDVSSLDSFQVAKIRFYNHYTNPIHIKCVP